MNEYNENLLGYLCPIDCDYIRERIGPEKVAQRRGCYILTEGLYGGWRLLLRDEQESPVAVIQGVTGTHVLTISNMVVRPDKRRQGIGSDLLNLLLEWSCGKSVTVSNIASKSGKAFFDHHAIMEVS